MGMDQQATAYIIIDDGFSFLEREIELGTWRKHPSLNDFMKSRWVLRGGYPDQFGCHDFILNKEDILALSKALPLHDEHRPTPNLYDDTDSQFVEHALWVFDTFDPKQIRITYSVF